MPRIQFPHAYKDIISIENALEAWREFLKGKRNKTDVQEFGRHLMTNVFALHRDLVSSVYAHGGYQHFKIVDPKPRDIHKASVRDRLLHHMLYRKLYPFFDRTFIADSYSCRIGKGTHKAMDRFRMFAGKVSRNNTRTCWVLKCDIRKFFASIDHEVLKNIIEAAIPDEKLFELLSEIIESFHTITGKGLPLGNLTSQLFTNVYMNEFDQFVKHTLKAKYYIRYADDFVFLSNDREELECFVSHINHFLKNHLILELHPDKLFLKTLSSGIDFLGWVHFPNHRVLRTVTKRRMLSRLKVPGVEGGVLESFQGLLSHGNTYKLEKFAFSRWWV